ncbi:MAG: hypothetical protein ACOYN3_10145, partial [Acidimicrobiia bacterium]
ALAARLTGDDLSETALLTQVQARMLRDHLLIAMKSLDIAESTIEHARAAFDCSPTPRRAAVASMSDRMPTSSRSARSAWWTPADPRQQRSDTVRARLLYRLISAVETAVSARDVQACVIYEIATAFGWDHVVYWEQTEGEFTCRMVFGARFPEVTLGTVRAAVVPDAATGDVVVCAAGDMPDDIRWHSGEYHEAVLVPLKIGGHVAGWCEFWNRCAGMVDAPTQATLRAAGSVAGFRLQSLRNDCAVPPETAAVEVLERAASQLDARVVADQDLAASLREAAQGLAVSGDFGSRE